MAIIPPPDHDSEEPPYTSSEAASAFRKLEDKILKFSSVQTLSEDFQVYWNQLLDAAQRLESERLLQRGVAGNSVEKYLSRGWAIFENQKVNDAGRIEPTRFSKTKPYQWILAIPVILSNLDGIYRLAPCLEITLIHHPSLRALGHAQDWKPGSALEEVCRIVKEAKSHLRPFGSHHQNSETGIPEYNVDIGMLAEQLENRISPDAWQCKSPDVEAERFWSIVRDALHLGLYMGEHKIASDPDFIKFARRAVALQSGSKAKNDPWLDAIRKIQRSLPNPLSAAKLLKYLGGTADYQTQMLSFPDGTPMHRLPPISRSQFDNKVRGQRKKG